MKIKTKLPLFTGSTALISIVIIAAFSILTFNKKSNENIERYRKEESERVRKSLKDMVNLSYSMIEQSYNNSKSEKIREKYGFELIDSSETVIKMIAVNVLKITLQNLRLIKFGDAGSFWINQLDKPYKIILHSKYPQFEGFGHVFYIGNTDVNIYEKFSEICKTNNEGFLEYSIESIDKKSKNQIITYVRYFEPLGWVIGSEHEINYLNKELSSKLAEAKQDIRNQLSIISIIVLIMIIFTLVVLRFLTLHITLPISLIKDQLFELSKGKAIEKLALKRTDEIGEIKKSVDELIDGLRHYSHFALEIGKGHLDIPFSALSDEDNLGNALLDMQKSLKAALEKEEKRKLENAKRTWATEGQAKFGEILREYGKNAEELALNIITNLVQYLNANQGGLFIYNDDDSSDLHLELVASIAYDRRKYLKKKIMVGDGIVGSCAIEKETVYMTRIPEEYLQIKSGLGTANPTCLLVVPLKLEDDIFGVMELASFTELETYQIEFVEKISQSIASSLFAVKMNQRTSKLLEEFRLQAEEKAAQEIEMLQNIEELRKLREKVKELETENSHFGLL